MATPPRRLDALGVAVDTIAAIADPLERAKALKVARSVLSRESGRLAELLRDTILELRAQTPPLSFEEIGALLDMTKQRVYQLAETRPPRLEPST